VSCLHRLAGGDAKAGADLAVVTTDAELRMASGLALIRRAYCYVR
jgi:hypothetical protein